MADGQHDGTELIDARIRREVAAWPAATPEMRARLAVLLRTDTAAAA